MLYFLRLTGRYVGNNKIQCIKALREITHIGLKEGKRIIEQVIESNGEPITINTFSDIDIKNSAYVKHLQANGIIITKATYDKLNDALHNALVEAVYIRDYTTSLNIINILNKL